MVNQSLTRVIFYNQLKIEPKKPLAGAVALKLRN
jgi:hypothetical protein